MPAFFVPGAESDPELAEQTYTAIKIFAEEQTWPISDRRIFRIEYKHFVRTRAGVRVEWEAEVGKVFEEIGEPCIAIFESNSFLVCTPNRGAIRGIPVMVGQPHTIIDFDEKEDS